MMSAYYRVLPYLDSALPGEPGHPLYLPTSSGAHRVDNPHAYGTLYIGDDPAGAVAESFGWLPTWEAGMLRGSPGLPGSVRAIVTYELDETATLCDLDNAQRLLGLGLRPSQVVTRDRSVTQAWALEVFETHSYAGVRWWSYYDPDWGSVGLWDRRRLVVADVTELTIDHPALVAAATSIVRLLV